MDTAIVAKIPSTKPADLKATGIDNIPVPNDAFNKCVKVSQSLQIKYTSIKYRRVLLSLNLLFAIASFIYMLIYVNYKTKNLSKFLSK